MAKAMKMTDEQRQEREAIAQPSPVRASAQAQAAMVTAELFVNGAGQEAERLVLTGKDGRDLGGWAQSVVQHRIEVAVVAAEARGRQQAEQERPVCRLHKQPKRAHYFCQQCRELLAALTGAQA